VLLVPALAEALGAPLALALVALLHAATGHAPLADDGAEAARRRGAARRSRRRARAAAAADRRLTAIGSRRFAPPPMMASDLKERFNYSKCARVRIALKK
jgi:hypothetical protein